ncbi:MAG: helix-turn-helix domain-containing protein [Chloroflexota bacterium]
MSVIKPLDIRGWEHVRDAACADQSLTIGARIAMIRTALRWTQEELGQRIGVHQNAISVWEQGKNEPQAIYVYRLAQTFRCSMDGLYSGGAPWRPMPIGAYGSTVGAVQCEGQKYLGVRCGRWTRDRSGYCRWHRGQAAEVAS